MGALNALAEVMWRDTPAPSVIPMYDGGLQVEWHAPGVDIELTVTADGERRVWIAEAPSREIDDVFRSTVEDLRKQLGALTRT